MLHIYVDGATRNNGKENSYGGYGVVIFDDNNNLIDAYSEYFDNVTNNQMELKAFLKAFEVIYNKYRNESVIIYSDSAYCVNILTDWIFKWSCNNWKTSTGKDIKNIDIIHSLYEYYKINFFICQIEFSLIKGHSGIVGNQIADAIAGQNIKKISDIILNNNININLSEKIC